MLKAIFLDMDETLCDTTGANRKAVAVMASTFRSLYPQLHGENEALAYLKGIYRQLDQRYQQLLLPVDDEKQFRLSLIRLILADAGIKQCPDENAEQLQTSFDESRTRFFDFFPGIQQWLADLRAHFTVIVITNGPEFSQSVKVERVQLEQHVDHVIIGGLEPEQKPAASIFEKAIALAACQKSEVIHVGDSLAADIQGANNAGIDSIWISHGEDLDESLGIFPTHVIEHPSQLRELIDTLHLEE